MRCCSAPEFRVKKGISAYRYTSWITRQEIKTVLLVLLAFPSVFSYRTVPTQKIFLHRIVKIPSRYLSEFSRYCIGTKVNPVPTDIGEPRDSDTSWQTPPSSIVPIKFEKYNVRPELITFDAVGVIMEPSQSIGRWYREILNKHCDFRIRLPRPALFTAAFKKAYSDMYV